MVLIATSQAMTGLCYLSNLSLINYSSIWWVAERIQ